MEPERRRAYRSIVDPMYSAGAFYSSSHGGRDAAFKVGQLLTLLRANPDFLPPQQLRIADVGCGSGETTFELQRALTGLTGSGASIDGYDVHPYVEDLPKMDRVRFLCGDFCAIADGAYDMVVLFDVIEHIPDPVAFIRAVGRHTGRLALHIPLDDAWFSSLRDLPRRNLRSPGHLLVLDLAAALNLLAFAGLRVQDLRYSPGFRAPSGRETVFQKLMLPLRALLYAASPYLAQKLLAGVSLSVIAYTESGLAARKPG